jgi:hypothetical protein
MPPRGTAPELVRVVEGKSGRVLVRSDLQIRFDYGHVVPWIAIEGREMHAIAGMGESTRSSRSLKVRGSRSY